MNKQDIINYVQDFTQHQADSRLDFQQALELRIAKFVMEKHFWWRRKIYKFQTVPGQALYDFTNMPNAPLDISFIREFMRYSAGNKAVPVDPFWDDWSVMCAQEDLRQGPPTAFTMEPRGNGQINIDIPPPSQEVDNPSGDSILNGQSGGNLCLRLTPIPDAVYDMKFAYLASYYPDATQPNFSRMVPPALHHILVDGLVMDITRFLFGPADDKFVTARDEYQASVNASFSEGQDFTSKRIDSFVGSGSITDMAISSSTTSGQRNILGW